MTRYEGVHPRSTSELRERSKYFLVVEDLGTIFRICVYGLQIVLVSSDGASITVERKVAIMSKTVQDMIEGML